jgi:hypothetical protein
MQNKDEMYGKKKKHKSRKDAQKHIIESKDGIPFRPSLAGCFLFYFVLPALCHHWRDTTGAEDNERK